MIEKASSENNIDSFDDRRDLLGNRYLVVIIMSKPMLAARCTLPALCRARNQSSQSQNHNLQA
jgi:hypothetical protein